MSFRNLLSRGLVAAFALIVGSQALAARTTTFFHNDGLGSVVAATNEAGQVLWRKDYAPFGAQIDSQPETERTSYTGKQHDEEIGLTYFGARYFDPEIARFVSVDPVGFVEDNTMSFNRYLYVNNNPYKYVDPDGQFLNFAVKFMADVAISVAINYMTSGSLGVGAALKDSAMGVMNPAKTLVKAKRLVGLLAKTEKKMPVPVPARNITCAVSCFAAGTTVLTERGYVPIETLQAGDTVWAHDPDTGVTALKPILATFINTRDSVWKLVLEKQGFRYLHEVTGSHPYYEVKPDGSGQWTRVVNLTTGAIVSTEDGANARVVSVNDTHEIVTTYNFEVEDIKTYYVSAAKVLVHNCNGNKGPNLPDFDTARRTAFQNAGMADASKVQFSKMDPKTGTVVEFKGPGGAKVGYDGPHKSPGAHHDKQHISWQSGGKRQSGGRQRGNEPYSGSQHPSRPDKKD